MLPQVSHQNTGSSLLTGASISIVLIMIITCSRLLVRKFRLRAFGLDDMAIVPACFGCVAYLALGITSERIGCLGQHIYNCTYEEYGYFYVMEQCAFPIFAFTVFQVKISIVLQNRRITGMTSKRWQITHWIYLAMFISTLLILVCINTFICSPVATGFMLQAIAEVPDPRTIKCLDASAVYTATRVLHILTDWFLLPIPLIIIWQLKMSLGRKIRLMSIFSVGFISTVASIVAFVLNSRLGPDVTYQIATIGVWDGIDIFFATVVASFPALNGILDIFLLRLKTWDSSSSTSLLKRLRMFDLSSQNSRHNRTRLTDGDTRKRFHVSAMGRNRSNSLDPFEEPILRQELDVELQRPVQH